VAGGQLPYLVTIRIGDDLAPIASNEQKDVVRAARIMACAA
jgi:hypothetical protein